MCTRLLAVVALFLLPWAVLAQEKTYTVKLKSFSDVGKSLKATDRWKMRFDVRVIDPQGNVAFENTGTETRETVYTETTLEVKEDGKRTRYQKAYSQASETKMGKEETLPYAKRTVVWELKDGKYVASVQGKPDLPQKVLEKLSRDAKEDSFDKIMMPKKAVAVGGTWSIDPSAAARVFGYDKDFIKEGSRGQGKLLKVVEKDGKAWGTMEFVLEFKVKSIGDLKFDAPAPVTFKIGLEAFIDGSSSTGKMSAIITISGKATMEQGGMKFTLEMKMNGEGTLDQSETK